MYTSWICLDFDDTICPSTVIFNKYKVSNIPLRFEYDNKILNQMKVLDELVFDVLARHIDTTQCYIVTYATSLWFDSIIVCFPKLKRLIDWQLVKVITRTTEDKKAICTRLLDNELKSDDISNFICMGDSPLDVTAPRDAKKDLGIPGALKSYKFMSLPSTEELIFQWKYMEGNADIIFDNHVLSIRHTFLHRDEEAPIN